MMQKHCFFLVTSWLLMACVTARAQTGMHTKIEEGRQYMALLLEGKTDTLYRLLSPKFQTAIKGKEGLAAFVQQLRDQLGTEISVQKEAAYVEAGFTSYYRISQFEKRTSATARWVWKDGQIQGLNIVPTPQPAASNYLAYVSKAALQLPFSDTWYVAWGGREVYQNKHAGAADQRFAYDFVGARNGELSPPSPTKNEDYYGFGRPVYSPGAGRVIVVIDSIADNALGVANTKSPAGNHVVIDHGNNEFSLLAHFKRGSILAKEGDVVKAGDLLGQCGNSGQSFLPHLHYHLQTGRTYGEGEGLPVRFRNYTANGKKVEAGEPVRGEMLLR